MEVRCSQQELANNLQALLRLVSQKGKGLGPGSFFFVAGEGKVSLEATDLECGIRREVSGEVEGNGAFSLPLKRFADLVRYLPKEELSLEFSSGGIILRYAGGEALIPLEDEGLSPRFPEVLPEVSLKLSTQVFKAGVRFVSPAVSKDDLRPALTGILFELSPRTLRFVATDGYQLALFEEEVPWEGERVSFLCPARILNEVMRLTKEDEELELEFTNELAFFKLEKTVLFSRLLFESFPDYARIIPQTSRTRAKIQRARLMEALARAQAFARGGKESAPLALLKVGEGLFAVSSLGGTGKLKESFPAEVEGEGIEIVFNASYLLEALGVLEGEAAVLEFNTETSPAVVRESEKKFYLVLPVRVR